MPQNKEAQRAYIAEYRRENRAKIAEKQREYRAKNAAKLAEYRETNRLRTRRLDRERRGILGAHGETREGECPICLRFAKLHLDHDWTTGEIRGWLCLNCNTRLGWLERPGLAERLDAYLTLTAAPVMILLDGRRATQKETTNVSKRNRTDGPSEPGPQRSHGQTEQSGRGKLL